MTTRNRAVAIIIKDNKILLLYRFKNGEEYYVFPGGGVEDGERVDEAVIREIKEETGFNATIAKRLWEYENNGGMEHFFLINDFSGELKLGGPEQERQSSDNIYRLEWISLEKVRGIKLLPTPMKEKVLEEFLK